MDKIWAPWRIKYIQAAPDKGCIFCHKPKAKMDARHFILRRKKYVYSMLNIYPYNNGHVLVAPFRHIDSLDRLSAPERTELMDLTIEIIDLLTKKIKPHGFNVGCNIGRAAGAGIDKHIHQHIVPRWNGDTNFMPVLTDVKIISQSLEELYKVLSV
ncbi:MAG: HIT domain-containing protein [Candidatus Omnitrophica bacterium]|nr:HIT domain-containing protein [Candidatus Omnitrophota bacterium]